VDSEEYSRVLLQGMFLHCPRTMNHQWFMAEVLAAYPKKYKPWTAVSE